MKHVVALLVLLSLIGCGEKQLSRPVDDVARTHIVGQYEDCTLYRTNTTGGPDITWVRCGARPKRVEANHTESCGKGCTRHVKTITVEDPQ